MTRFVDRLVLDRPYTSLGDVAEIGTAGWISQLEHQLESDRGRIINSAAVRRLQQKTQVFPLEHNAAVRSRLTHSLEVQQTGRFIVRTLFERVRYEMTEADLFGCEGLERIVESLVEMSCLMHDIGNPPFGHFGEAAISRWFKHFLAEQPQLAADDHLTLALQRELGQFEGNAQAIRLLVNLQTLNLTYLQTACVLKYTRCATEPKPEAGEHYAYLRKKPGFYFSEQTFVQKLYSTLQIEPGRRFALTYLMEAADDIAYCLADLEDGVDKGILSYGRLAQLLIEAFAQARGDDAGNAYFCAPGSQARSFADIIHYACKRADREPINKEHEFFLWLRVQLIHPLVRHVANVFIEEFEAINAGALDRALIEDGSPFHTAVDTLKQVAVKHVFCVPEVQTLELQGYRIISGLLEQYRPLLELSSVDFARLIAGRGRDLLVESRLFQRLPNKHVKAYCQQLKMPQGDVDVWEYYSRCRLIQDMISGMTDQYALDEYQTLTVSGK